MPNIKSAEKRVKVSAKKAQQNRATKTTVKNAVKKVRSAPADEMMSTLPGAFSTIDSAVSKGVLHKNTANRKKSRLAKAAAKAQ